MKAMLERTEVLADNIRESERVLSEAKKEYEYYLNCNFTAQINNLDCILEERRNIKKKKFKAIYR